MQVKRGTRRLGQPEVGEVSRFLRRAERGLIVCGPMDDDCFPQAVSSFGPDGSRFPVLADPLSQLRSGTHDKTFVIGGYNSYAIVPGVAARLQPDVVIRFGAMPVSKAFFLYMQEHTKCRYVVVDDSEGWRRDAARVGCHLCRPCSLVRRAGEKVERMRVTEYVDEQVKVTNQPNHARRDLETSFFQRAV